MGIGEVRKIDQLVADDKVEEVFSKMGSSLASAIAKVALTDEEEAALVEPSNLFVSPKMWPRFHRDVKIFMEACLSHAKKRIPAQMIVTNDHKFSSMFLNSPLAEDVLHSGYGCAANPRRSPCQASRGTCGWDVSSMAGRECNSIGLAKPTLHGNI